MEQCIEALIKYAKEELELNPRNEFYIKNQLYVALSNLDEEGFTEDKLDEIYGLLSLLPSEVNDKFQTLFHMNFKAATDWFYNYCVKNNYVKRKVLDQNPRFEVGNLIITINKAKPEFRDPKKAAQGNSVNAGFAKCVICRENEGLAYRNKRTLRTVDLTLGNEKWFWQYSPYGYFNEHGIAVNTEHIPMHVDQSTYGKLMDFVDAFPHYFIGCNAALPRIGGSVLAHDHYQGGGEILPMHKAKSLYTLKHPKYANALIEVVDWQGSVIRIISKSRCDIEGLSEIIRTTWITYDNPSLGILHEDEEGLHHAISPTVIKTSRGYEMSIILRSNITSKEYPDGVFHAHPEFHMIKKESIGLIEAQGLFILPGRLEEQLSTIEALIEKKQPLPKELQDFQLVYDEVKQLYKTSDLDIHSVMQKELGSICSRILENTAVFKEKGQMLEFLAQLGFTL